MTVKYDLSSVAASVRVGVARELNEKGILFNLNDGVLSIADEDESIVDDIVGRHEMLDDAIETIQQESVAVSEGVLAPSCELCGRRPAAPLTLRRQVGMLVVMSTYRGEFIACGPCGDLAYKEYQKQTAIKGWTGVKSALMNPVVIGANSAAIKKHRDAIAAYQQRGN